MSRTLRPLTRAGIKPLALDKPLKARVSAKPKADKAGRVEGGWREGGGRVEGGWREGGGRVEGGWREGGGRVEGGWREGGGRVKGRGGDGRTECPYPGSLQDSRSLARQLSQNAGHLLQA